MKVVIVSLVSLGVILGLPRQLIDPRDVDIQPRQYDYNYVDYGGEYNYVDYGGNNNDTYDYIIILILENMENLQQPLQQLQLKLLQLQLKLLPQPLSHHHQVLNVSVAWPIKEKTELLEEL